MARQLLVRLDSLQKRLSQLRPDQPVYTAASWQDRTLARLHERDTMLFRHPLPARIYTTAATLSAGAVLNVNVASFVVTWRDDAGINISQLIAYIILIFPVTLCLWGLLTASALFVAYGHHEDFGQAAAFITVLATVAVLVLGISGPYFLPPLTWSGHAWAVYIGV